MIKIQTLITTMDLIDYKELLERMNIKHNYIIGNQCNENKVIKNEKGMIISTDMRGVGQNRNNIIERSDADICILADDDMRFCDDYEKIVKKVFADNPKADVIIFNFIEESKGRRVISKKKKIGIHNYMNYGAARFAFRRTSIIYHAISFNTMFGGGTPHQCGEDSLFLNSCLKAGLNIIAVPEALAFLTEVRDSTWFEGYNKKYFFDKGVFLGLAHPLVGIPFAIVLLIKHREFYQNMTFSNCLKNMINGFKYIKRFTLEVRA